MVNPILLPELREMIQAGDASGLAEFCQTLHPATAAEFMEGLSAEEIWQVLSQTEIRRQAEIFEFFPLPKQIELVHAVEPRRMARLLEAMPPDERADLLAEFDEETVETLLRLVAQDERDDIRRLLSYPPDSAGAVMTTEYATLSAGMTAGEAITVLRHQAPDRETIYYVYVIDKDRQLIGFVSLQQLILAPPAARVADLMQRDVISVRVSQDKEEVARKLARYDFIAIPVVDDANRLVGIVTHDDVIDVVMEEASEDAMLMGGMAPLEQEYLHTPLLTFAQKRGLWLTILFCTGILTATALSAYEGEFERFGWLVFFIPLVLSCGGNSGSQSATLIIRALAVDNVRLTDWWRIVWRELSMGVVLGTFLGAIGYGVALLFMSDFYQALVVPIALFLVVTMGTLIGSLLPMFFKWVGLDPAITSNPFVSSISDVIGILVYFAVARGLLS